MMTQYRIQVHRLVLPPVSWAAHIFDVQTVLTSHLRSRRLVHTLTLVSHVRLEGISPWRSLASAHHWLQKWRHRYSPGGERGGGGMGLAPRTQTVCRMSPANFAFSCRGSAEWGHADLRQHPGMALHLTFTFTRFDQDAAPPSLMPLGRGREWAMWQ